MIAISKTYGIQISGKWLARATLIALMLTLFLSWSNPVGETINTVTNTAAQIKRAIKPVELQCLAENIYHEAGNQPEMGKVAVGVVTMNRTLDRRFPKSVCGVVKQSIENDDGTKCQFSWVCMGKEPPSQNNKNWRDSLRVARMLLEGGYDQYKDVFENAKFFHAASLKTDWNKKHDRVGQIGDQIFYK